VDSGANRCTVRIVLRSPLTAKRTRLIYNMHGCQLVADFYSVLLSFWASNQASEFKVSSNVKQQCVHSHCGMSKGVTVDIKPKDYIACNVASSAPIMMLQQDNLYLPTVGILGLLEVCKFLNRFASRMVSFTSDKKML
jgi:hypothetical protein